MARLSLHASTVIMGAVAALVAAPLAGRMTASAASSNFVTGVLPPPPAGSTAKYNQAAEPAIRSDEAGRFYISSENGLGSGTDAWKTRSGAYVSLPQPNEVSSTSGGTTGLAPGGGDTDLSTATAKNAKGVNNVYVASLTLGSVTVSASQDTGTTWANQVFSATVPGDDREFIAAFGLDAFDLSYHAEGTGDQIIVNEGKLVSGTPASVATYDAINPAQVDIANATLLDNEIGNLVIDQKSGDVYQVFVGCAPSPTALATCSNLNTAYMAVGVPTGTNIAGLPVYSFTDYQIFQAGTTASLDNNFPNVAVDKAGNVYAAWSDDHNVYVSYSTSHGKTWSAPHKVNSGSAKTAIFPWMAALATGEVDIVYYGTPAAQNYQTCATTSATDPCQTEKWSVFFAQNLHVLQSGGTWSQQQVTGTVHAGGVCQGGVTCTSSGNDNRDLYDDFGVAVNPNTGLASIAYSDDQHGELVGTANAGECTSSQNNTASCDHTDFATQVAGTGI